MIDNTELIIPFCPSTYDGDSFIYTEVMDRGKKKGNNGHRILKTFYHRCREEFEEQLPIIKQLCDASKIRACTRLALKSFKKVGKTFTRLVVEASLTDNWVGMKTLYHRACGITSPNKKIWLLDIDVINADTTKLGEKIEADGHMLAVIPSKKGLHYIVKPFGTMILENYLFELNLNTKSQLEEEVSFHRDNPTNLYIPDGAD